MKGIVYDGATTKLVEGLTLRDPGPREVVVRIAAAGLCHSDLSYMHGLYPVPSPGVCGHEAAGVVDAVGNATAADALVQAYAFKPSTWSGSLTLANYSGNISVTGVASGNDNTFDLTLPNRDTNASAVYQVSLDGGNTWSSTSEIGRAHV